MDIGAFVITTVDDAVHNPIAQLAREHLEARGQDPSGAKLAYGLTPKAPSAMAVSVLSGVEPDPYLWHSEHSALGGEIAARLGVEVWCVSRERRTGFVEGVRFDAAGMPKYRVGEESDRALKACARRLRVPKAALLALLEQGGTTIELGLDEDAASSPLGSAVAEVRAAAGEVKPKAEKKPRRSKRESRLPDVVAMGAPEAPGEERFKVPAAWAERIDRRRGGWFAEDERVPVGRDAYERMQAAWARLSERGRWLLFEGPPRGGAGHRIPSLIDAVVERFEAPDAALGSVDLEAATAGMLRALDPEGLDGERAVVDWWIAEGGLGFAVEALVRAMAHAVAFQRTDQTGSAYSYPVFGPPLGVARALRRHLASASEERFGRAREHCAALRCELGPGGHHAVAYLFESEPEWVAAAGERAGDVERRPWSVWPMASWRENQLYPGVLFDGFAVLPAMVEGFGRELVEPLIAWVAYAQRSGVPSNAPELALVGEALASIPTDEAMRALLKLKRKRPFDRYAKLASSSYPERAARLA